MMTLAEYFELFVMFSDSAASNLMNYVTVYFAFLAAVYLVGGRLRPMYFWPLLALYSFFASIMIFVVLRSYSRLIQFVSDFRDAYPSEAEKYLSASSNPLLSPEGLPVMLVITYLASVAFAILSQRGKTYKDDT